MQSKMVVLFLCLIIDSFTAAISYNVNFENAWLWKGWCEQKLREYP